MNTNEFKKIEFWIATSLYLLVLFILIAGVEGNEHNSYNEAYPFNYAGIKFHYFQHYFIPKLLSCSLLYATFIILNFYLVPALLKKSNMGLNALFLTTLFVFFGLFNSIIYTYSKAYQLVIFDNLFNAYSYLFLKAYTHTFSIFLLVTLYVIAKHYIPNIFRYLTAKYTNARIYQECLIAVVIWVFVLIILTTQTSTDEYSIMWFFVIPLGILQYGFSLNGFIKDLKMQNIGFFGYLWRSILLIALCSFAASIVGLLIFQSEKAFVLPFFANLSLHATVTTSFCWLIYNYRQKNSTEISHLKKKLGKSDASLSFLQSQINPHFLFNALNTLYGTALQENAERTGEGIQKLGDMMRFMLHENVKDKISLTRDVDYLENYIALQKLRTSRSSLITIDTQIDEQINHLEITPMLLIPFVENAFKHGISLQNPSHIKVTLQTKENTLYFDVHNSIHIKPDHDPEKLKSGIGLLNVKQRLALLYPGKHELIIRESAKEFFIHLTLQL